MRILVSLSGMVRLIAVFFVLGLAVGLYFGVAGSPDAAPPAHEPVSVNVTAP
jgi:hypothetical protein